MFYVFQADNLHSALNSFYSEMATIESSNTATNPVASEGANCEERVIANSVDKIKKKKKTKVCDN